MQLYSYTYKIFLLLECHHAINYNANNLFFIIPLSEFLRIAGSTLLLEDYYCNIKPNRSNDQSRLPQTYAFKTH